MTANSHIDVVEKAMNSPRQQLPELPIRWLNTAELARHLGFSAQTVRKLTRDGRIPYIAISRRCRRYNLNEVLAALSQ